MSQLICSRHYFQVKHLVKHEYSIFNKLRMSVSKDWKMTVEQFPILQNFNPYEECTGFVPACNYLIKHKNMVDVPAFTLYDAFGLDKKTIGRLAKAMGKYCLNYFYSSSVNFISITR